MEDGGPTASIIFVLFVFINIFFYGFGAAISSLNEKEVRQRAKEQKDKRSIRLSLILDNPTKYINTLQLVVTLINLLIGSIYFNIWLRHIHNFIQKINDSNILQEITLDVSVLSGISLVATMFVLVYVLLTFGVLLPKKIAAKFPEKWAYSCINIIYYVMMVLSPLTSIVTVSTNGILRIFGMKADEDTSDVTEEEIILMVNEGHEQGVIEASEAEMITNIFEFGDKEAQDIMTNRTNIIALSTEMTLGEAIQFMLENRNSRYPVYEENIDHIVGILHLKDALRRKSEDEGLSSWKVKDIEGLLREAKFIPQTRNIDDLFKTMQSLKQQMVIVIDEYGQTVGLVAMEDILEEIVGNIMDEYDEEDEYIEDKGNDVYIVDGMIPLEELEENLDINFGEQDFETLNGFLISKLDRIPEEEEDFSVDFEGYRFEILKVENKRIQSVSVTKLPEINEDGENEEEEKE